MAEPLSPKELLAEVRWLLEGHVHPLMISQVLGRTVKAIYEVAYREKDELVAQAFGRQQGATKPKKKKLETA